MNKKKKEMNKWVVFVKEIQKANPDLKYYLCLTKAKPLWAEKKQKENDKATQTETQTETEQSIEVEE